MKDIGMGIRETLRKGFTGLFCVFALFAAQAAFRQQFDYTKIDAAGNPLPPAAGEWSCVLDNRTGLLWEVKTFERLHGKDWTYAWYNGDFTTHGGYEGRTHGGACAPLDSECNTEIYVSYVNAAGLCGFSDWRMPNINELVSIVVPGVPPPGPTIDLVWFPNTLETKGYWSETTSRESASEALAVKFSSGKVYTVSKHLALHIRLVRGGGG